MSTILTLKISCYCGCVHLWRNARHWGVLLLFFIADALLSKFHFLIALSVSPTNCILHLIPETKYTMLVTSHGKCVGKVLQGDLYLYFRICFEFVS